MFGVDLLMIIFNLLLYVPKEDRISDYSNDLRRFLRLHKRYHQLSGNEICCICLNINLVKAHFQNYVSDPKLYPPSSFLVPINNLSDITITGTEKTWWNE